jgi:zinc D-Ala-D-Ala dipeptidase
MKENGTREIDLFKPRGFNGKQIAHTRTPFLCYHSRMKIQSELPIKPDDAARREFWSRRMDEAYAFMQAILRQPVAECGEPLRSLREAVAAAGVEAAFSDVPFGPGMTRQFYLREGLIPAFLAAARDLNAHGLILKVEDAFRTRPMQKSLAVNPRLVEKLADRLAWECGHRMPDAAFITRRLAALIAHCPKTGTHLSASAMDMSVLKRDDGTELDRGALYLELSELTPMDSPFIPEACRRNRQTITALMRKHGFAEYPFEFWHYCAGDGIAALVTGPLAPVRYGPVDWDPVTGRVTPIDHPAAPLNTDAEIMAALERALRARGIQ